jgi:hypothetical protein
MQYSQNAVVHATLDKAEDLLYEAGLAMPGKPLRRSSWREIAAVIHAGGRIANILMVRLRVAGNRQDLLRVLRIARKWRPAQPQKSGKGGKASASASRKLIQEHVEFDDGYDYYWYDDDYAYSTYEDFLEWQAEQSAEAALPEVHPVSPVQAAVVQVVWERRSTLPSMGTIGDALDVETYSRLMSLVEPAQLSLSDEAQRFLEQHDLLFLLDRTPARPIVDGYGLRALEILRARHLPVEAFTVNWFAVERWLRERITVAPDAEMQEVVIACYHFVASAPVTELAALLNTLIRHEQAIRAWLPLLPLFLPRLHEVVPAVETKDLAEIKFYQERHFLESAGSMLVLHNLHRNICDLLDYSTGLRLGYRANEKQLLLTGASTLRRQQYPSFTLSARPQISLIAPQTLQELKELFDVIAGNFHSFAGSPDEMLPFLLKAAAGASEKSRKFAIYWGTAADPIDLSGQAWTDMAASLTRHAIAYAVLREQIFPQEDFRVRRKHIRRFWEEHAAGTLPVKAIPDKLRTMSTYYGIDRVIEGVIHALLTALHDPWPLADGGTASLKIPFTIVVRLLSVLYRMPFDTYYDLYQPIVMVGDPLAGQPWDLGRIRGASDLLLHAVIHAPLEVTQGLQIPHEQGLPLLNGGRECEWQRRTRQLLRQAAGGAITVDHHQPARLFACKPLPKRQALNRGALGGDCSTSSVPLRALSAHHTYYGVWEGDEQQRGYMTVFECWAEGADGERVPALCLETINVPIPIFDAVQEDLLLIFESIARSRGLHPHLVLSLEWGTWNYRNSILLRHSRRYRQGEGVRLWPADPVAWSLYTRASREGYRYVAFAHPREVGSPIPPQSINRILAPFKDGNDLVLPENRAEAERLAALPAAKPIRTGQAGDEVTGFISSWPRLF